MSTEDRPSKAELVQRIEDELAREGGLDVPAQALADDVAADRR